MQIRIQKLLARAGIASRRKAEEVILAGRVAVNGVVVTELGVKAAAGDEITVDGVPVLVEPEKKYIMLHKPTGVVTTASDPQGRKTVMEFVPASPRLFPVGRLDFDTSGLLFFTNDGEWANALAHPRHEIKKTYVARLRGEPTEKKLKKFREGIIIDGRKTAPAEIKKNADAYEITISEGRNRQVRKMCEAIGHPVITLKRVAVGGVVLGGLPVGEWRELTESEVALCMKKS